MFQNSNAKYYQQGEMPSRILQQLLLLNQNPDWLWTGSRSRRSSRLAKKQKQNYFVAKPRPGKKPRVVKRQVLASTEPSTTRTQRQEIGSQANGSEGLELITIDDDEEQLEHEEEAPDQQNYSTTRQEIANQANGSEGFELITIDDDEEQLEHEDEEEAPNQQNCSFMQEVEMDYNDVISSSPDDSVDILLNDSTSPDDSVDVLLNDTVDSDSDPVTENSNSGQDGNETIDLTGDEANAGTDLPIGAAPPQASSVFLSMGVGDAGPICPVCLDCFDNIKKKRKSISYE